MSTPINSLPLKTSQTESDIDDPMIQNVLKEFENDMPVIIENTIPIVQQPVQQPVYQPLPQTMNTDKNNFKYNESSDKKLFDFEIAKKAAIITIIMFLIYHSSLLNYMMAKLPQNVAQHITGKELIISMAMVFAIFYVLIYYEII